MKQVFLYGEYKALNLANLDGLGYYESVEGEPDTHTTIALMSGDLTFIVDTGVTVVPLPTIIEVVTSIVSVGASVTEQEFRKMLLRRSSVQGTIRARLNG